MVVVTRVDGIHVQFTSVITDSVSYNVPCLYFIKSMLRHSRVTCREFKDVSYHEHVKGNGVLYLLERGPFL